MHTSCPFCVQPPTLLCPLRLKSRYTPSLLVVGLSLDNADDDIGRFDYALDQQWSFERRLCFILPGTSMSGGCPCPLSWVPLVPFAIDRWTGVLGLDPGQLHSGLNSCYTCFSPFQQWHLAISCHSPSAEPDGKRLLESPTCPGCGAVQPGGDVGKAIPPTTLEQRSTG